MRGHRPSGHSILAGSDPAMLREGQGGPSGLSPWRGGRGNSREGTGRFCWLQVTGSAAVCAFLPSPLASAGHERGRWE